jgi:predicted nucleotidyltransferase
MKTSLGISDLLFPNKYRRRVLALLLTNPGKWIHLRELARLVDGVAGTLKKEMDALVAVGLLRTRRVGNQTQFCANPDHPVYPELVALIKKSIGFADHLRAALLPLADHIQTAFVFGSMASASDTDRSDIDVMIIGDLSFGDAVNALYDDQTTLGREINPKVMTGNEWQQKKLSGSTFIQDILGKPKLMLLGAEHDL